MTQEWLNGKKPIRKYSTRKINYYMLFSNRDPLIVKRRHDLNENDVQLCEGNTYVNINNSNWLEN